MSKAGFYWSLMSFIMSFMSFTMPFTTAWKVKNHILFMQHCQEKRPFCHSQCYDPFAIHNAIHNVINVVHNVIQNVIHNFLKK